jgi:hypothetical protein
MYYQIIETTQDWVCPKDGEYYVVAVAGGQGSTTNANTPGQPGGPTSFGGYLTASGNWAARAKYPGIMPGYNLFSYGANGDAAASFGYGSGGHLVGADGVQGGAGKMNIAVLTLSEGETVHCTIGEGGAAGNTSSGAASGGTDGVITIQEV